jgi:hypothetical protein
MNEHIEEVLIDSEKAVSSWRKAGCKS